jgi:hypothetical protein
MNTVSRQAPASPIVSFSKVVNRLVGGVDEKLSIVIRSTESAVEVGLLNHYVLDRSNSLDAAALGLKLPAGTDGPAFVEAFVAAYTAPRTILSLFEGWYAPVFEAFGGGFDQSVEYSMAAYFVESGDVTHKQHEAYAEASAERIARCEEAAAGLN